MDQSHPRPPDENTGRSSEQQEQQLRRDPPVGEPLGAPTGADRPDQGLDPLVSEQVTRLLAAERTRPGSPQPADVLDPADPELSILAYIRSSQATSAPPAAATARPEPMPDAMPHPVAQRIGAALAAETRLRVDPGPLRPAEHAASTGSTGATGSTGTVTPFGRPGPRRRAWMAVAAVAAAAAVIATGGSLLHLNKRTDAAASLSDPTSGTRPRSTPGVAASASTPTGPTSPSAPSSVLPGSPTVHIQLSSTKYAAGNLAQYTRRLLNGRGPEIGTRSAEAPSIGPLATPIGLASCLRALPVGGASPVSAVSVDLASYDNAPAAVVVVTHDAASASTAWVVERSCSQGDPHVIKAATLVP